MNEFMNKSFSKKNTVKFLLEKNCPFYRKISKFIILPLDENDQKEAKKTPINTYSTTIFVRL